MRYITTNQNGFTLMEMLVTISIIAILTTIALPSFKQTIINVRMKQAAETVKTALEQARAESYITQKIVSVNVSGDTIITKTTDSLGANIIKSQKFDKNIVVTAQSGISGGVYFNRSIPRTSAGNPLDQSNSGFAICYSNENSYKYIVSLKGYNTVGLHRVSGGCS